MTGEQPSDQSSHAKLEDHCFIACVKAISTCLKLLLDPISRILVKFRLKLLVYTYYFKVSFEASLKTYVKSSF